MCRTSLTEQEELTFSAAHLLRAQAEKLINADYLNGEESVWIVTFTDYTDTVRYRYLLGENGEQIDHVKGNQRFTNTRMKQSEANLPLAPDDLQLLDAADLYNENGQYFYFWSVDEKAAFSAAWKQIVDEIYGKDESSRMLLEGKEYYWWTRRVWGTPDSDALTEEDVLKAAVTFLSVLGKDTAEVFDPILFYDITDPTLPQWRLCLNHRYYLSISAKNGELLFMSDTEHGSLEKQLMFN